MNAIKISHNPAKKQDTSKVKLDGKFEGAILWIASNKIIGKASFYSNDGVMTCSFFVKHPTLAWSGIASQNYTPGFGDFEVMKNAIENAGFEIENYTYDYMDLVSEISYLLGCSHTIFNDTVC